VNLIIIIVGTLQIIVLGQNACSYLATTVQIAFEFSNSVWIQVIQPI